MLVPQIVLRDFSFPPIPSLSSGDIGKLLCRKLAENNVRALFTSHRGDFFPVKKIAKESSATSTMIESGRDEWI